MKSGWNRARSVGTGDFGKNEAHSNSAGNALVSSNGGVPGRLGTPSYVEPASIATPKPFSRMR